MTMICCDKYLDAVKRKHGLLSDYKLAKFLNETPNRLHNYRKGGSFNVSFAIKIAEILRIKVLPVIVNAAYQRAENPEEKAYLKAFYQKIDK